MPRCSLAVAHNSGAHTEIAALGTRLEPYPSNPARKTNGTDHE